MSDLGLFHRPLSTKHLLCIATVLLVVFLAQRPWIPWRVPVPASLIGASAYRLVLSEEVQQEWGIRSPVEISPAHMAELERLRAMLAGMELSARRVSDHTRQSRSEVYCIIESVDGGPVLVMFSAPHVRVRDGDSSTTLQCVHGRSLFEEELREIVEFAKE